MATAATYYVSPSGNDSNPGTGTQPYRTVARGVQQAVAGDTVILGDGTYGNEGHLSDGTGGWYGIAAPVYVSSAGNSSAWITLKAQNKGQAILDCGSSGSSLGCDGYIYLTASAAYWSFEDLVFTRGAFDGLTTNDGASHIRVKGCRFEYIGNWNDTTTIGEVGIGFNKTATDWWVEGNIFHDIGRTNGYSYDHGIYASGTNIAVVNNIFYNMTHGWGIQLAEGANNWMIANNTFAFPNPAADGQIMLWNTNTNITIRNNIFYNPQSDAIARYTSTVNGCNVDHNVIYGASSVMSNTSGCTLTSNQVGVNPMLVNASSAPFDFHIQAGSPMIDAGITVTQAANDFAGMPRPQGGAYDIGAYEYAAPAGPSISGVFVSAITSNSAAINWITNIGATSAVQYGTSGYSSSTSTDVSLLTIHSVILTGLDASSTYHFRVVSQNATGIASYSGDATFTTLALPPPPISAPPSSGGGANAAQFVKTDTTTLGNWKSAYGNEGFNVVNDTVAYPSYATVASNGYLWTWASSTSDIRSLQKTPASNGRIAATWYSGGSGIFTIDVNLTDGKAHQVAVYCYDWDARGRSEQIDVLDAQSGAVLDSRNVSSFNATPQYLVWNLTGHVIIRTTLMAGPNAVISGIFFGGGSGSSASSSTAGFLGADTSTLGNWKGVYGRDGSYMANDAASYPSYATVGFSGQNTWTWASSTGDIRALQETFTPNDRIAATWYTGANIGNSFDIDVNLTDGGTHRVAIYSVDWDSRDRIQKVEILDAQSGVVLDTRSISSFGGSPAYLSWNIAGHVVIRTTLISGPNAVVSGLFFN